jgi:hypothetical protein
VTERRNYLVLGALFCVIVALVLLVAGLTSVELQPGRPFPLGLLRDLFDPRRPSPYGSGTVQAPGSSIIPIILVWIILPLILVYLLLSPQARREFFKRVLRWTAWTVLFYIVVTAWRRLSAEQTDSPVQAGQQSPSEEIPPIPAMPAFISSPPQWFVVLLSLMVAALLAVMIWWLVRRRAHVGNQPIAEIAQDADDALSEIRAGADLRDTITRCYNEMSKVLQTRGIHRHNSMTPREFERHLSSLGVQDAHVSALTQLFERIRYGPRQAGPREEERAIACLQAIVDHYGGTS